MNSYPELNVPSPLGVGLVLGLITTWRTNRQAEPGSTQCVVQAPAGEAFAENLQLLSDLARRDGLGHLYEVVPWARFTAGPVGTVRVIACDPRPRKQFAFKLELADPRPAWSHPKARQGGLAFIPRADAARTGLSLETA